MNPNELGFYFICAGAILGFIGGNFFIQEIIHPKKPPISYIVRVSEVNPTDRMPYLFEIVVDPENIGTHRTISGYEISVRAKTETENEEKK